MPPASVVAQRRRLAGCSECRDPRSARRSNGCRPQVWSRCVRRRHHCVTPGARRPDLLPHCCFATVSWIFRRPQHPSRAPAAQFSVAELAAERNEPELAEFVAVIRCWTLRKIRSCGNATSLDFWDHVVDYAGSIVDDYVLTHFAAYEPTSTLRREASVASETVPVQVIPPELRKLPMTY